MDILAEHKYLDTAIGVYELFCTANGRTYVGSTKQSFKERRWDHIKTLRKNTHRNIHIQRTWNKYGENSFVMRILEICEEKDTLEREKFWMVVFESCKYGFNINSEPTSRKGVISSKETRQRISAAVKKNIIKDRKKPCPKKKETKSLYKKDVKEIEDLYKTGEWSQYRLAKQYDITPGRVYHIVTTGYCKTVD